MLPRGNHVPFIWQPQPHYQKISFDVIGCLQWFHHSQKQQCSCWKSQQLAQKQSCRGITPIWELVIWPLKYDSTSYNLTTCTLLRYCYVMPTANYLILLVSQLWVSKIFESMMPLQKRQINKQLECGPMPNVMVALPNIGGALCSTPQSLADAHY